MKIINWLIDNLFNIVTFIIALYSAIMQFRRDKKQDNNDKVKEQKEDFSKIENHYNNLNTEVVNIKVSIAEIKTELKWLAQITPFVNKITEISELKKTRDE